MNADVLKTTYFVVFTFIHLAQLVLTQFLRREQIFHQRESTKPFYTEWFFVAIGPSSWRRRHSAAIGDRPRRHLSVPPAVALRNSVISRPRSTSCWVGWSGWRSARWSQRGRNLQYFRHRCYHNFRFNHCNTMVMSNNRNDQYQSHAGNLHSEPVRK